MKFIKKEKSSYFENLMLVPEMLFFLFFGGMGLELRAFTLGLFCDGYFFKIGSHELFAQAGFKP
jgi:hypothetical protein